MARVREKCFRCDSKATVEIRFSVRVLDGVEGIFPYSVKCSARVCDEHATRTLQGVKHQADSLMNELGLSTEANLSKKERTRLSRLQAAQVVASESTDGFFSAPELAKAADVTSETGRTFCKKETGAGILEHNGASGNQTRYRFATKIKGDNHAT